MVRQRKVPTSEELYKFLLAAAAEWLDNPDWAQCYGDNRGDDEPDPNYLSEILSLAQIDSVIRFSGVLRKWNIDGCVSLMVIRYCMYALPCMHMFVHHDNVLCCFYAGTMSSHKII